MCDTVLDWSTLIVGKTSPWLQLDSRVEVIRRNSEAVRLFTYHYQAYRTTH